MQVPKLEGAADGLSGEELQHSHRGWTQVQLIQMGSFIAYSL